MPGHVDDRPAQAAGATHALPDLIRPLFHNYRADCIDTVRDTRWIILTILSRGDWDQLRWLFSTYGWQRVEVVVRDDMAGLQTLPRSVANLWSVVFWGHALAPRPFSQRWTPTRTPPAATGGGGR